VFGVLGTAGELVGAYVTVREAMEELPL